MVGQVVSGGRRLRIRVDPDLGAGQRGRGDRLREATVRSVTSSGPSAPVPLGLLGRFSYRAQPAAVRTEGTESVAYVYVDLDAATNLGRYVDRLKAELDRSKAAGEIALRPGERIEWAGQYALLEAGQRRLKGIALSVLVLMFGLLLLQFRSVMEAIIVLCAVPFALVGSVWTVYLFRVPLSAPGVDRVPVTSTALTLEVLPVLSTIWRFRQLRRRSGAQS